MIIFAILAMSLDILLGYTGLPSLGHAGIFGVAAYTVAVMSTTYHAGFWTCVVERGSSWARSSASRWDCSCLTSGTSTF